MRIRRAPGYLSLPGQVVDTVGNSFSLGLAGEIVGRYFNWFTRPDHHSEPATTNPPTETALETTVRTMTKSVELRGIEPLTFSMRNTGTGVD
jgi:hypothetical protein